ncbi:MAG TPA: aldehyde dehydrogenase family protein [Solimonas sp.]
MDKNPALKSRFDLAVPGAAATGRYHTVHAPFDRQPIGEVERADAATVEQALKTAHALYRDRKAWLPQPKRIEMLERARQLLLERAEDYAREAAREGGKPLPDSRVEIARAADSLRACVDALRTQAGDVVPMNLGASSTQRLAFTLAEPIGVVVAISAFNHPMNLIAHQVGPAIAAGCPVIVKPAGTTPLSCFRFVELLREAGLPEAWCQPLLPESSALSTTLATDARVAFLSFIGSARVGWSLRSQLAPGARCALEHGGVAPVVVAADADLDVAVPLIAKGGFYHAGQVCVSVQRVFVARSLVETFCERLVAAARKMKVGDPTQDDTEIGPLIVPEETERVHGWVKEALADGAQLLCGGHVLSPTCYSPTVLLQPTQSAKVSTQEVFGPVICVYAWDELDDALQQANALPFAFQAAVFTRDLDTAMRCYRGLDASAVMVNDHTAFRVDWMPFAGLKQSGLGVGGIRYSLHDMQVQKMMVIKSSAL